MLAENKNPCQQLISLILLNILHQTCKYNNKYFKKLIYNI